MASDMDIGFRPPPLQQQPGGYPPPHMPPGLPPNASPMGPPPAAAGLTPTTSAPSTPPRDAQKDKLNTLFVGAIAAGVSDEWIETLLKVNRDIILEYVQCTHLW